MRLPLKALLLAACSVLTFTAVTPACAQFAKPEDAINYREAAMTLMSAHVGRIFAMANGKMPFDAKAVAENAEIAAAVSTWQFTGFVEGSDKGKTRAEPKIWTEMAKFREMADKNHQDVVKLNEAAKTGNLDTIKAAVGAVGKSCKACHDSYRKD